MKRIVFTFLALLMAVAGAEAKYWKIGPSSVVGMDFASINAAMSSSLVAAGDTLYLDQYYNESAIQTVTKRVVIIGTGYDTSFTDEKVVARLTSTLALNESGIIVKSLCLNQVYIYAVENCTLDRCYCTCIYVQSSTAGLNHVYSCYVAGYIGGYSSTKSQMDIQNCVIYNTTSSTTNLFNLTASVINNNVIYKSYSYGTTNIYCLENISNTQITNNLVYCKNTYTSSTNYASDMYSSVYASGSGNSIEHNIFSSSTALTYFPNNKTGWLSNWSSLFVCQGNYSDYYKLKTGSNNPALTYATDGGEVGCHGGLFGCPSGGRPQYIPYFTKVVVGSRTENGTLPVSVTIKIQDE